MKTQNRHIPILAMTMFIAVAFTSCESYVDIDIPEQDPKVVVGAFISPQDEFVEVIVRSSNPLFHTSDQELNDPLTGATVMIGNGNSQVQLPYDQDRGLYRIAATDFPIVAGQTYSLQVDVPGYKTVNATTQVPLVTSVFTSTALSAQQPAGDDFNRPHSFDVTWQDVESTENFYRVSAVSDGNDFSVGDTYFTDDDRNQQLISEKIETYQNYSNAGDTAQYTFYLLNVTDSYYHYMRSLEHITYGDPFSEPSIIYTNINNGLGCFGAFNGSSELVTVP